jgi:Ni/Co efflux regulator RcnB
MIKRISAMAAVLVMLGLSANAAADEAVVFTGKEIAIITEYYGGRSEPPPARGRKHKELPPGIARNLARGKPLPPGIAKQVLPDDLLARLPPPRDGHERVIIDGKVVLVEAATQVVRDVITGVILP